MIISTTKENILLALTKANEKFDNNLTFNNFQRLSDTRYRITLKVKDSHGKGARLASYQMQLDSWHNPTNFDEAWRKRRHLISACWHAHGTFFDNLPEGTKIQTREVITYAGDAWQDFDIGSKMFPYYASEACDCNS